MDVKLGLFVEHFSFLTKKKIFKNWKTVDSSFFCTNKLLKFEFNIVLKSCYRSIFLLTCLLLRKGSLIIDFFHYRWCIKEYCTSPCQLSFLFWPWSYIILLGNNIKLCNINNLQKMIQVTGYVLTDTAFKL